MLVTEDEEEEAPKGDQNSRTSSVGSQPSDGKRELALLTAGLAQRSTHIYMKIIYVENSRVLLGVFKHQHLYF
jgi:hypothetical protein